MKQISDWVKMAQDALRLSELATPGRWGCQGVGYGHRIIGGPKSTILMDLKNRNHENNGIFVAFAREALPDLANAVMALGEKLSEIEAQERWIPVEESLPDEGIEVLVCRAGHGGDVVAAVWEDGCWREVGCGFPLHGVTHWKDMPEGLVMGEKEHGDAA